MMRPEMQMSLTKLIEPVQKKISSCSLLTMLVFLFLMEMISSKIPVHSLRLIAVMAIEKKVTT